MAYFNTNIYNQTMPTSWTPYDMVARKVPKSIGPWEGSYVITPSFSQQIFLTANKTFERDLVVEPITLELIFAYLPELIYRGATSAVPMFYPQVFNTKDKFLQANFTVEPIPVAITTTAGTDGLTVSIWKEDPYPLEDAQGLPES